MLAVVAVPEPVNMHSWLPDPCSSRGGRGEAPKAKVNRLLTVLIADRWA
jgi:hypothetical protein